jgi:hypothetical protein
MRSCVPLASSCGCTLFAKYMCAGFHPLHPLRRLGFTLSSPCFLSFAHAIRSSIRALVHGDLQWPIRVPRPPSPRCAGLSRACLLSLTGLSLLLLPTHSHAPTAARRSMLYALNRRSARRKHLRQQGETPRSHSDAPCPLHSHHAEANCNLALAPPAPPRRSVAVPGGWVSVDVRGVFSHGHLGEGVCSNVA